MPGQIKKGGGPDSTLGPYVCQRCFSAFGREQIVGTKSRSLKTSYKVTVISNVKCGADLVEMEKIELILAF